MHSLLAAYIAVLCLWLIFFMNAVLTTSRQLRFLPYSPTRYAQLSFRCVNVEKVPHICSGVYGPEIHTCSYFWYNNLVVVLFVVAVNSWPIVEFLIAVVRYQGQQVEDTFSVTATARTEAQVSSIIFY